MLTSRVEGFRGRCTPTWLNTNLMDIRLTGSITGFFRLSKTVWLWYPYIGFNKKYGEEFHGRVEDNMVFSTERKDDA